MSVTDANGKLLDTLGKTVEYTYDGDGNRTFQLSRQIKTYEDVKSELSDKSDAGTKENVDSETGSDNTTNPQNDASSIPDAEGQAQAEVHTYYEKVYADPADTIFWYGFGQGGLQLFANGNTSFGAYLSNWLTQAWDGITSQYELVLHSEAEYSATDIETLKNAGLSDEDIADIIGCELDKNGELAIEYAKADEKPSQLVENSETEENDTIVIIPNVESSTVYVDYDLTYYVNDINTANTQVLMTYGRNDTEKSVYTYGEERIAEDDLQTEETAEYLYDGRGSVVQTTIYAEVELSITYDPFGEITGGVDENFVGYAYNGEESSEVTGLQYLRARYYDTELGSFLTIDSYLGSLDDALSQNRYTYANNDPVNNIDPSGHYSVNVNGANQYYQSTGLNEIRDYMTASALWAGEVSAQNGYNNAVARANNTSFQNYASISGISQSTADSYINKGIAQAGQVSMNYGCSVPTVPNEAVAEFADNVNDARESANAKIEGIKQRKKEQYDDKRFRGISVGTSGITPASSIQKQAMDFFEEYFGQDFTADDLYAMSFTEKTQFFNELAKYINAFLPNLSVEVPYMEIQLGYNIKIYSSVTTTGEFYGGEYGDANSDIDIDLMLKNQELMYEDFVASTGIKGFSGAISADGTVEYSVSNEIGNNTATMSFSINPLTMKVNAEYSVSTDIGNDVSISSKIGLEKILSEEGNKSEPAKEPVQEPIPETPELTVPSFEFDMESLQKGVIVAVGVGVLAILIYMFPYLLLLA